MLTAIQAYRALFRDRRFFHVFLPVAIPIALQNLVTSLTGLGSGLLVGQLGDAAVAGVSLAGQVTFVLILAAFGIGSGAAIFSSQYWGRSDAEGVARTQGVSLMLSLILGLGFAAMAEFFPQALLGLFTPDVSSIRAGAQFLQASAFSFPFMTVSISYSLILRSIGQTRWPLVFSAVSLVVQLVTAPVLMFGWLGAPAWGTLGAGWAVSAARLVEMIGLIVVTQIARYPNAGLRRLFHFDGAFFLRYLKVALPVAVNEVLWSIGISAIKAIYGWMGATELAAVSIVEIFGQMVFIVFFGTGNAASVVIGQAIGRSDRAEAQRFARNVALFAPLMGIAVALPLACAAPFLPLLFNVSLEVRSLATQLIWALCLILPGRAFYHDMIVGVLRGGGDTTFSLWMDQSGIWLWALPLGWLMAFVWHWPFLVVYFVIALEEPLKSGLALWRMHTGRWIRDVTHS